MAADILRRVGWALIVVGLLDIGYMVYCIMNEMSYGSSLNIFAVIAGVFLLRQSMTAARIVSFFAAFYFTIAAGALILFPVLMPSDLLVFQLRISHVKSMATTVVGVVLGVALLAFTFWVYRSLTSPAVMEARRAAGVNAQKPIIAFVGGALAVGLISVLIVMAQRTNGSVAP